MKNKPKLHFFLGLLRMKLRPLLAASFPYIYMAPKDHQNEINDSIFLIKFHLMMQCVRKLSVGKVCEARLVEAQSFHSCVSLNTRRRSSRVEGLMIFYGHRTLQKASS